MMTEQRSSDRAALHGHPSAVEIIASDHPNWDIHRTRDEDGTHGDWSATREGLTVTSPTTAGLVARIEEHELGRLQSAHAERYHIHRKRSMWIATARLNDGTERTLIRDTADGLDEAMTSPGRQIGYWAPLW